MWGKKLVNRKSNVVKNLKQLPNLHSARLLESQKINEPNLALFFCTTVK